MQQILCRHSETGHECEFPEDALPAWRGRGWVPVVELPEPTSEPSADPASELPASTTRTSALRQTTKGKE